MGRTKTKLIRDRVHGFVEIPRRFLPLVDSTEFQRLRRLTQLGTSSITYPGAEHSRFQHSLGVAHLFALMAKQFSALGNPLSDMQFQLGFCAALLHDIGHGPYSHALEGVLARGKDHEQWTCDVLLSDETDTHRRLHEIDPTLPRLVADVISKSHTHPLLVSMISSQMDVDRMDYLLRDSECVGVQYGRFDVQRLGVST